MTPKFKTTLIALLTTIALVAFPVADAFASRAI